MGVSEPLAPMAVIDLELWREIVEPAMKGEAPWGGPLLHVDVDEGEVCHAAESPRLSRKVRMA